ncbi:MAG: M61 family metallopeptidase [Ignavibacteriae bacterium]|nr:M61 family metallopeptidase [Ignavibacteriota bacterium]
MKSFVSLRWTPPAGGVHLLRSVITLLLFCSLMTEAKPTEVHYTLGMSKPHTHFFEVEVTLNNLSLSDSHLDFVLPVWRPGRYMVLDFAGGVQEFSAIGENNTALTWKKTDKTTWRVETKGNNRVTIRYKVFANEFNQRTRGLNDEHGFVDGTAVFMYVEKFRALPVRLNVIPFANWHVITGLESAEGTTNEFTAPNYDVFVDCPLEIGTQKDFPFEVEGVPHVLSIAGEGNWNADTLIKDITKIVQTTKALWGEFPYKRYVFLVHCSPTSGGGTEHLNSVIMGTRPFIFNNPETYRGFLGLVAHEYFHTWNVKQLRPNGMHPYDYLKENYTDELWISEGTTSYYDNLMLVRAGYQTTQKYLDDLANGIQSDRQRPGNNVQSIVESSFDSWIKFWRGTQQSFNTETDYYGKGSLVSLLLDLELRQRTSNNTSLDDVLRTMYKRFPLSGNGYTVKDFQTTAEELSNSNLKEFFTDYVFGTKPLPWEQTLAYAGLELKLKDTVAKPWIGFSLSESNGRTTVSQISAGSPAYNAGVDVGDELVAMNGFRIRPADLSERVKDFAMGESVTLTIMRGDKLRTIEVKVEAGPLLSYRLQKVKEATELQKEIFEKWLATSWDESSKK